VDEQVQDPETRTAPPLVSRDTRVRPPRARGRWIVVPVLLLAVAVALWLGLSRPAPRGAGRHGRQALAQPVGAATIATGDIRIVLNELGTVTPLDTVTVKTQVNGQLTQVAFQEGQIVSKGQFLAQIDPRPFQAALQHDQGQLAHDQGLLAQAKADLQRFETLGRQNSIALQQVQDQRYLVEQDAGTVKADEGTVAADELNLAYAHIVSPVTGRIGLRNVDPGNFVQTTDANGIVVIAQMQPISVVFSVPQQDLSEIEDRLQAGAKLPATAYDQANVKPLDQGHLAAVDNEMDTATGTVKLRALLPNPKNQLFPFQFVNVHLLVDTLTHVVRVPVAAVQLGAPGTYVWVINANGTVTARPVKLGPVDGQYQQVLSGLTAGERVVTDGTDRLRDGTKITIPPPATASGGQGVAGAPVQPGTATHRHAGRHAKSPTAAAPAAR
jgi:multidrug efflux system membrane fusion protein